MRRFASKLNTKARGRKRMFCRVNRGLSYFCFGLFFFLSGDGVPTVFVAVAGRSNGLGPVMSGNTAYPVINCPPLTPDWGAQDVWSSLRMPSGECSTSSTVTLSPLRSCVHHPNCASSPARSRLFHDPLPRSRRSVCRPGLRPDRSQGVVQTEGIHAQHLGVPEAG